MSDLLDTLGKKDSTKVDGKSSATADDPAKSAEAAARAMNSLKRGEDLTKAAGQAGASSDLETSGNESVKSESSNETNSTENKTVKEPDTWTKETALKEVVKLREENKVVRTRYQEQMEKIKSDFDQKLAKVQEQQKEAMEAKKKLEALEAEKADKQRDLSERVAHRETVISKLQTEMEVLKANYEKKLEDTTNKINDYEVEREAHLQVYKARIKEEIDNVPEKFKKFAETMVKGYNDPREAWTVLSEAKMQGLFEDKTVVVNHSVPGAKDGARSNPDKIAAAAREVTDRMTSQQKIKAGLEAIRKGEANSAFRTK